VVTLGKLRRIEAAEALLAGAGFQIVRVRDDQGGARVEVAAGEVERLAASWQDLAPRLQALGFERAAFDPRGYRRGGADLPPAVSAAPSTESAAASPAAPPPAPPAWWRP
jgi:PP-loop superfamily ATP-utilizing enzyme